VAVAVPLLLLVARDLLLHDPPRVLAWRLLHEPSLRALPRWLAALVPAGGALDRDPLALLLGAAASGLAVALLIAGLAGARARVRALLLAAGGVTAVVLPTSALVAMGQAMERPYGQDGGVVQLPLALDRLTRGQSPYDADYSGTILARQAHVSPFWQAYGGNPLLRHHAYLPGTHLLMLPGYLASRAASLPFDPRTVTLLAWLAAAALGARLAFSARGAEGALAAAALVLVNPLVYWPQDFGANDVIQAALLLLAVELARRDRRTWCGVALGLACASKQLAWPYAPFLLAALSGARDLRGLLTREALRRMAGPAAAAAAVMAAIVLPVLALDPRAFWRDIVVYNVGLPAPDSYPLGGTPGFGAANFLIYFGRVASLRDHVSFAPAYLLLAPLCLLLLRRQLREAHPAAALVTGSAALLASVYVSRVAHPNYLVLAAILLPVGLLALPGRVDGGARAWTAEAAVGPLLLFALAVELVEHEPLRALWEDAVAARLPAHAAGTWAALLPRAGPELTADPLGLLFGALAAGLGVVWLMAALLGAPPRARLALGALALLIVVAAPSAVMARVGQAAGIPRAQDEWLVAVSHSARQALGQADPAPVREAWSMSFRHDPPAALEGDAFGTPSRRALGRVLAALGAADPRWILAAAVLLAGAVAVVVAPAEAALPLAAVALVPAAALGAVFGSGIVLALPLVLAALACRRHPLWAAVALGLAAGVSPRLLLIAPLLLPARPRLRPWLTCALTFAAVTGLAMALAGPKSTPPQLMPSLGLPNLMLYAGATTLPLWLPPLLLLLNLAAMALLARRRTDPDPQAALAATFLLASLWLSPATSPNDVAIPLALLALSPLTRPTRPTPQH